MLGPQKTRLCLSLRRCEGGNRMYLEGSTAAWMLFGMGFLSCGFLGLVVWHIASAIQLRAVLKLLEDYLENTSE